MTTSVNASTSGTPFITGTVSGIDTAALIENAVRVKLLPKRRIDDQVSRNLQRITSYQKLSSQANALKAAFEKLKSDVTQQSVFDTKQPTFASSNASITPTSVLSATVGSTAIAGSYDVVVNSTARAFSAQSANQTSQTTALGYAGTFDIVQTGKTAATITISAGDTLQDVRNKINATTATSGVSADILQVSPGMFRLVVRGADTAQNVTVSNITGDNVTNLLGLTNAGGSFSNITQVPTQASITLNGTTILSNSNKFENVLTGVTIDVLSAPPSTTITVNIGNNVSGVRSAIEEMVNAFNTLRQTSADLRKINPDGTPAEGAFLIGDSINNSLGQMIGRMITSTAGSSSVYNGLSALGVDVDKAGVLSIDSAKLDAALNTNFNEVRKMFQTEGATPGLANLFSSEIDTFASFSSGSIQKVVLDLQTRNISLNSRADDIKREVDSYQLILIQRYAKLEASMKRADTLKRQVRAILDAGRTDF